MKTSIQNLVSMLQDVTASLDNVLLHHGKDMPPADLYQRRMLVASVNETLRKHGHSPKNKTL